jgi:hypothetical protein
MDWIGEERAKRTVGSPKGWRRAEVWMRTAKWDGETIQDWKEAVSKCTGVPEGVDDEDQWELDAKDERWELLERYKIGKGKLVEGCYGPEPAGLERLHRIHARWACRNTAEYVRYVLQYGMNDKRSTNGEENVRPEGVAGVSEEARTNDERQEVRLEDVVDEVQEERNERVIHDVIETQGAAHEADATGMDKTETISDGVCVERVGVGDAGREERESEEKGKEGCVTATTGTRGFTRESRTRARSGRSDRERGNSPVRTRAGVRKEGKGILKSVTNTYASRSGRVTEHGPVRNRNARNKGDKGRRDKKESRTVGAEREIRKEGRVRSDGDGSVT